VAGREDGVEDSHCFGKAFIGEINADRFLGGGHTVTFFITSFPVCRNAAANYKYVNMRRQEFFAGMPWWAVTCPDSGIVTGCDAPYFGGLCLLCDSVRGRVPVSVVDLGLTADQRAWCGERAVNVLPNPVRPDKSLYYWHAWYKPYYVAVAPYKYCLWLDPDTIVVGDLNPVFAAMREGPVLVRHPQWNEALWFEPKLMDLFKLPQADKRGLINNGVLGFIKGDPAHDRLRALWMFMVNLSLENPAIRSLIYWFDEGCLNWAISAGHFESAVVDTLAWNKFTRQGCDATSEGEFFDKIHYDPTDVILHFTGHPKPWSRWI